MSSVRWPSLLRRPSDGLAVEEGYHLHDVGDIGGVFDLLLAAGPVYGNVIPAVDNTYDLGTAVLSWRYLYAYGIYDEAGTLRFDLSGNLTPAGDIIPATDSDLDLGTAALSFDKIYANALYDEAGVQRLDSSAWLRMPDGANNTPAFSFTSDPDTGWYLGGDGILTATVAAVAQLSVIDGVLVPATDNDIDLGTSALSFKNLYAHAVYDEAGSCYIDLSGLSLVNPSNSRIQAAAALAQLDTYESGAFQARVAAVKAGNVTVYDCDGHIRQRWTDGGIVTIRLADETVAFQVDDSGNDPVRVRVSGAMHVVTEGAADSGGAGYKVLRVPN